MSLPPPEEESPRSPTEEAALRRLENLRAVMQGASKPSPRTSSPTSTGAPPSRSSTHRTRKSVLAALGTGFLVLLGKLKFLGFLAGVLKVKTLATMLLSIGLYATEWGLPFALGFVVLIFIHECGHAIAMRREGIPAGPPVFIPFLGAFIAMRGRPRDAYVEAKVSIGGPIAGSLAAWATLAAGLSFDQPLLITLGHAGILLNLFNLIPVSPLDGGGVASAFSRTAWIVGYALGLIALVLTRSPILLVVLVVGLFTLWRRWRHPVPGYHAIPRSKRLAVGIAYGALVIALVLTLSIGFAPHPKSGA
jgi:Zn-dependent protease